MTMTMVDGENEFLFYFRGSYAEARDSKLLGPRAPLERDIKQQVR